MLTHTKAEIETAAEHICIKLHPAEIRNSYIQNISVFYQADTIVYVLQALSAGMTALFVGLITNHLYDKTKKPDPKLESIEELLKKQHQKLNELEALLKREENQKYVKTAHAHKELHQKILNQIEKSDPTIAEMVDDAIKQLKS